MAKMIKQKTRYIFCNTCKCETNHVCEGEHHRDYQNYNQSAGVDIVERVGSRYWICAGCQSGTLEIYYDINFPEFVGNDEAGENGDYYPERNKLHVRAKEFKKLPEPLTKIYQEMLGSFNNDLAVLCGLGVRTLLEGICSDKKIKGRNLRKKIDNLDSILPKNIVANLHSIRFIGNEAAHELSPPNENELRLAIELCEDLLNFIYELDYKASRLTIARQLRKKSSTTALEKSNKLV